MKHPIKHTDGTTDHRYALNKENCDISNAVARIGRNVKAWVARFCGEWIGTGDNYKGAENLAIEHNKKRIKL